MPSCPQSTPVPEAQQQIAALASDLRRTDERLSTLAVRIAPDSEAILPAKLRAGIEVIREDLLSDAIDTLDGLAALTEEAALKRQGEIADAITWLSPAA